MNARTLADLKVGDPAIISDGRAVTVVNVARIYLTVKLAGGSRELTFRIDNGREKNDRGIGAPPRLLTCEEHAANARRHAAITRLRELGLYVDLSREHRVTFTTETLEAILAVIPDPAAARAAVNNLTEKD